MPSADSKQKGPRGLSPVAWGSLLLCATLAVCALSVCHVLTSVHSALQLFLDSMDMRVVDARSYREYVRAVSPSGDLTAIVYRYDGPSEYDRWVVIQPSASAFDPSHGTKVFFVTAPPFIDLQWTGETNLVVTCLGIRGGPKGIYKQLNHVEPNVTVEYQFIERTQDTLTSKAASPDDSYIAGVFERAYGSEPETITQLVIGRVVSGNPGPVSRVISPNHDWVPITVRGSHEMPFYWKGPATLVLDCTGIRREDVCYMHSGFSGVTVEYVGLPSEETWDRQCPS